MRKTIVPAVVLAALTLAACGGSNDDAGADQTTGSSEETPGSDETADETQGAGGGGEIADLSTALLAAEDLPADVQIQPFDMSQFSAGAAGMADLLEGVTYEPADCADTESTANPLGREGIESAAMTATAGTASVDVLVNAVYSGATTGDIADIEDYADRCPSVAITGTVAGQEIDMTVTNTVTDEVSVDADASVALEASIESASMPVPPTRVVYVVDGDYGLMLSANPEGGTYDLDALVQTALDKLRAAQG